MLLLDEPTTALDLGHQQQVLALVDELRVDYRLTVITTMHDLTLAGALRGHARPPRSTASPSPEAQRRRGPRREATLRHYYRADVEVSARQRRHHRRGSRTEALSAAFVGAGGAQAEGALEPRHTTR